MHTKPTNGNGSSGIASRAATTAHGVVDRIAEAAVPVVDKLAGTAHFTVDKAASAANRIEQQGKVLAEASGRLLTSSADYVRGRPLAVLAIGLAAGFLLSRLIRLIEEQPRRRALP